MNRRRHSWTHKQKLNFKLHDFVLVLALPGLHVGKDKKHNGRNPPISFWLEKILFSHWRRCLKCSSLQTNISFLASHMIQPLKCQKKILKVFTMPSKCHFWFKWWTFNSSYTHIFFHCWIHRIRLYDFVSVEMTLRTWWAWRPLSPPATDTVSSTWSLSWRETFKICLHGDFKKLSRRRRD